MFYVLFKLIFSFKSFRIILIIIHKDISQDSSFQIILVIITFLIDSFRIVNYINDRTIAAQRATAARPSGGRKYFRRFARGNRKAGVRAAMVRPARWLMRGSVWRPRRVAGAGGDRVPWILSCDRSYDVVLFPEVRCRLPAPTRVSLRCAGLAFAM